MWGDGSFEKNDLKITRKMIHLYTETWFEIVCIILYITICFTEVERASLWKEKWLQHNLTEQQSSTLQTALAIGAFLNAFKSVFE